MKGVHAPIADRLAEKYVVDDATGCWVWTGATRTGYGRIGAGPPRFLTLQAHRVSYEFHVGPIPKGLYLDHLCGNRLCGNPAHLEPVTNRENVLRGSGPSALNARKTHCPQGHPYAGANLMVRRGARICRECHLAAKRRSWHRNKAA